MPHLNGAVSDLLTKHLPLFYSLSRDQEVIDLACGGGRNGLFLLGKNISVTFVDKNEKALAEISSSINKKNYQRYKCLRADLEDGETSLFEAERFGAILAFNYLHRPLFPLIRSSIFKGGFIFYETFTNLQPKFGKPRNPNYLLNEGELLEKFKDWEIIDYFEGVKSDPQRSVASLVARKP